MMGLTSVVFIGIIGKLSEVVVNAVFWGYNRYEIVTILGGHNMNLSATNLGGGPS
jgi:hypothetical protein